MVIEVIAQATWIGFLLAALGLVSSWVLAFVIGGFIALFLG